MKFDSLKNRIAALDGLREGASPGQEVGKRTFPGRMNQVTSSLA